VITIAIRVPITHPEHSLFQCAKLLAWIPLAIPLIGGPLEINEHLPLDPATRSVVTFIGVVMGIVLTFVLSARIADALDVQSARYYMKRTLGVSVSFGMARPVAWLFVPNGTDTWYPIAEVRDLPVSERWPAILAAADRIAGTLASDSTTSSSAS